MKKTGKRVIIAYPIHRRRFYEPIALGNGQKTKNRKAGDLHFGRDRFVLCGDLHATVSPVSFQYSHFANDSTAALGYFDVSDLIYHIRFLQGKELLQTFLPQLA